VSLSLRDPYPRTPYGLLIRDRRVAQGKSIRQLALLLGVSDVRLGEVERGRRRAFDEALDADIARFLRIEPRELAAARERTLLIASRDAVPEVAP